MNTRWSKLTLAALAALSFSGAQAADNEFYVGVGGGQADFKDQVTNPSGGTTDAKASSHAYKAFFGYRLKAIPLLDFAAEAGYHYFGQATHNALPQPSTYRLDGASLAGLAILPLGPVDLFAKGGAFYSTLRKDLGGTTTSRSGTDPFYGAGIGLRIGRSIGIRAEYEYFDVGNLQRAQAYTASVLIRF